eukprot:824336-Amphidinium_carterae.1
MVRKCVWCLKTLLRTQNAINTKQRIRDNRLEELLLATKISCQEYSGNTQVLTECARKQLWSKSRMYEMKC